jgi:hypothetical protein
MDRYLRDQICDWRAAKQFGAFSGEQALRAGHSRRSIGIRLRSGRWYVAHSGVYVVAASPDTWERRAMAAQLLAGSKGALSHYSSAAIWGLTERRPPIFHITTSRFVRGKGVRVHRSLLEPHEIGRRGPFVITSPSRTLIDLASLLAPDDLEDCFEEALHRRLLDIRFLSETLMELGTRGRRGAGQLRRLIELRDPALMPTENDFETLLHRVLRKADLPIPMRQVPVFDKIGFIARLDFAYPKEKVGLPADSYEWHARRRTWEKDIEQRNRLLRLGWRLRPTTWTELKRRPTHFTDDVAALLHPAA